MTDLESLLLVLGFFALIWTLASIGNRRLVAQEQMDRMRLLQSPVYYEYFCPNGHYLGPQEPTEDEFCRECVRLGRIKANCGDRK